MGSEAHTHQAEENALTNDPNLRGKLLDRPAYVPGGTYGNYEGAYADRRRRFDIRAGRRRGDRLVLDVPTFVLWVDDDCPLEYDY